MDLKHQRNRFLAFAFASADLLIELGEDGHIAFAMGAAQRLLGVAPDALIGMHLTELVAPAQAPLLKRAIARVGLGQRFGPIVVEPRNAAAATRSVVNGCRMPEAEHTVYLTLSEAKANALAEAASAARDPHTGLLDEKGFEAAAKEAMRLAREAKQDVALTLVELPDLKEFEERAGHGVVATFLGQVGSLLRALSVNDATARLSDEKFGLIADAKADAHEIAADVARLASESAPDGVRLTAKGANVAINNDLDSADAARALLYTVSQFASGAAASPGRSLNDALDTLTRESTARIHRIRTAIGAGLGNVVAQPIVDLSTRRVKHHELLVRFARDASPYDDVVFAEKVGIVHELDFAMAEFALRYLANPASGTMSFAVNVSGRSITNPAFLTRLMAAVKARGSLKDRLIFEITETAAVGDPALANRAVQALRRLGFPVCLDDFGAGAASFQYLRQFEVDFIKIDGEYVRTVLSSPREAAILKSIVTLARELKAGVIAEQVESPHQVQRLRALGCGYGQGFLFGRPAALPVIDAEPMDLVVPAARA